MMRLAGMSLNKRKPSRLATGPSVKANPPTTFSSLTLRSGMLGPHPVRVVRLRGGAIGDAKLGSFQSLMALVGRLHEERERAGGEERALHGIVEFPGSEHVR